MKAGPSLKDVCFVVLALQKLTQCPKMQLNGRVYGDSLLERVAGPSGRSNSSMESFNQSRQRGQTSEQRRLSSMILDYFRINWLQQVSPHKA